MFFIAKDEYKSVGNNNSKTTISKTAEFTCKDLLSLGARRLQLENCTNYIKLLVSSKDVNTNK